jgi:hypothetical protein
MRVPAHPARDILCQLDSTDTTTEPQPVYSSASQRSRRLRTLFGALVPTSGQGNAFLDLYSDDGFTMTLHSPADVGHYIFLHSIISTLLTFV